MSATPSPLPAVQPERDTEPHPTPILTNEQRYGLDCATSTEGKATSIALAGFVAVGRYYSMHTNMPQKNLTREEAIHLTQAGLSVFVVYQDAHNKAQDFDYGRGQEAATNALDIAHNRIQQPQGSAIYFAVDYDASQSDYDTHIKPFFEGVNQTFTQGGSPYRVGVYGSGLICENTKRDGLAQLFWLSQSLGFRDSRSFLDSNQWTLSQHLPQNLDGLDYDPDLINPDLRDFGQFRIYQKSGDRLSSYLNRLIEWV
ncbi:DUF1906 domain-containing protein [Polycladidibacter hongkongensis]|uniref:DUF1906 domain-containing protein n=1 Tax=Polycladidibacter hongkongensis TaxID=1647556 RepID=UPI00083637D9|nr:DUF1906 domain-containing protein [Pseudovibrio hongkongensis]